MSPKPTDLYSPIEINGHTYTCPAELTSAFGFNYKKLRKIASDNDITFREAFILDAETRDYIFKGVVYPSHKVMLDAFGINYYAIRDYRKEHNCLVTEAITYYLENLDNLVDEGKIEVKEKAAKNSFTQNIKDRKEIIKPILYDNNYYANIIRLCEEYKIAPKFVNTLSKEYKIEPFQAFRIIRGFIQGMNLYQHGVIKRIPFARIDRVIFRMEKDLAEYYGISEKSFRTFKNKIQTEHKHSLTMKEICYIIASRTRRLFKDNETGEITTKSEYMRKHNIEYRKVSNYLTLIEEPYNDFLLDDIEHIEFLQEMFVEYVEKSKSLLMHFNDDLPTLPNKTRVHKVK